MNEYNGKSSEEIRADIERTRSDMSEKIDTIQERLSPDNLKLQAQGMVQDIIEESTDAIVNFMTSSAQQAGRTLVDTIKHNPLPSAVVGLGLGWLLMNTFKGQRSEGDDRYYRSDYGRMSGQMGYGGDYGRMGGQMDYGRGMGEGSMTGARVPYSSGQFEGSYTGDYGYEEWQETDILYNDEPGMRDRNRGGIADKAGQAADKAGRTAKDIAGRAGETAQNLAGNVAGAVQDAAGSVGSAAQNIAGRVGETAQNLAGSVAQPAADIGQQARHQAVQAGQQVAHQASSLTSQTQHQAARAGRQVQRSLEDNPIAFGAAALITGMAIGLALPATRQERQLFGDMRDQVMDRAQSMATNIAEEARQVAAEVKPRLEETAQRVVEDLKQSGKEATHEVKESLKEAGTTVKSRVEEKTGVSLSSSEGSMQGNMQGEDNPDIVSGTIVEGDQTHLEPNVGGGYESKFDTKS